MPVLTENLDVMSQERNDGAWELPQLGKFRVFGGLMSVSDVSPNRLANSPTAMEHPVFDNVNGAPAGLFGHIFMEYMSRV